MSARHEFVLLPSERASGEAVARQSRIFAACPAAGILERLPVSVVVFNTARQIVHANARFLAMLPGGGCDLEAVLGCRLGEVFACQGADAGHGGCGLSPACRHCGAGQAMAALFSGDESAGGECRLNLHEGPRAGSLDFRMSVWAMPQDGEMFHAAVLTDTRAEKRLALMERIFYHDILNLMSGMKGVCELIRHGQGDTPSGEVELLLFAVERVTELIASQRDFSQAERGEYELASVRLRTVPLLEDILALMRQESSCRGKMLVLSGGCADLAFHSDRKLVTRILINMVKNALEATPSGGTVTAGCDGEADTVRLWVRNPGEVPSEARAQIFRRTFSTKGKGRGLGTYGMKLFAENYLQGEVGFTSDANAGTEFFVRLPYTLGCTQ